MAPTRPGAQLRPGEEPVAPPHWNGAQAALKVVRVHGDGRVLKERPQAGFPLRRVLERLGERAARQQAEPLALRFAPVEGIDGRRAALPPEGQLRGAFELFPADGLLVKVDRPDQRQGLGHARPVALPGVREVPPAVRPALGVRNALPLRIRLAGRAAVRPNSRRPRPLRSKRDMIARHSPRARRTTARPSSFIERLLLRHGTTKETGCSAGRQ